MKRFNRLLALLLVVVLSIGTFCFASPVGALSGDERSEIIQLIGSANCQSILAITNEYQSTNGFISSVIYSSIAIGSNVRNFISSILTFSSDTARESLQKDIDKQEMKIIQDVLFNSKLEFDNSDSEMIKNFTKVFDKLTGIDYLSICSTGEITQENKEQFEKSLKKIMPEIRDAFPNIDNTAWDKLVGELNTIDIINAGLDGVTAIEKICYAITTCNVNLGLIEKEMNRLPSDSKLYQLLGKLKEEVKSGFTITFWNQYLKDKVIDEAIKGIVKAVGKKAAGVGLVSSTLSWTSFLNEAIFKWMLSTPSINDWVVAIDMCEHINVLTKLPLSIGSKLATGTATNSEILQALSDTALIVEMCNATLDLTKSFAKYNKTYGLTFLNNEIAHNDEIKNSIFMWKNKIKAEENVNSTSSANTNKNDISSKNVENGVYVIVSAMNNNKAIEVVGASVDSKANIQLNELNYGDNQKFSVQANGNHYSIINVNSQKSIDVSGGDRSIKTNLWQYAINGTDSQKWEFFDAGNGYCYIKSALGAYIDAQGGKSDNGTNIWMYQYNGTVAQKWMLIPVTESVHICSYTYGTEKTHPHKNYKYCSDCGEKVYTDNGNYKVSCDICNPASVNSSEMCNHNWKYDNKSAHPHKAYRVCTKCGEKQYTGETGYDSSCNTCNPQHIHSYTYGTEKTHPHKNYKYCSDCGEKVYTDSGNYKASCDICNPAPVNSSEMCNHNWEYDNESAHPHKAYRVCTKCGEKQYTGGSSSQASCSECWGGWSDWTTSSISSSSTRQVETKTQYVYYHYLLTYDDDNVGAYPIDMATANYNFRNFVNAHVKAESYHEYYSDSPLSRDTSGRLKYTVGGEVIIYDKYYNYCSNDSGNFNGNANYLYYKGTRTLYRYRDLK